MFITFFSASGTTSTPPVDQFVVGDDEDVLENTEPIEVEIQTDNTTGMKPDLS
jgi:hypothetical protein